MSFTFYGPVHFAGSWSLIGLVLTGPGLEQLREALGLEKCCRRLEIVEQFS
jgi:hypothetical protein